MIYYYERIMNELTAATVSMSNTLVQYRQAFAFPYFVWHSSKKQQKTNGNVLCKRETHIKQETFAWTEE